MQVFSANALDLPDYLRPAFVSRYIERGPVLLARLKLDESGVIYETKEGEQRQYDPLEFLALLSSRIPKRYESLTRYYGHYSCRVRGERMKREAKQQSVANLTLSTPASPQQSLIELSCVCEEDL